METGGWIILVISVGSVTAFFGWSLFMTLTREPPADDLHSTLDRPPDIGTDD